MAPRLGLGGGVTANPASGLFASTPLLLDTYPNAHRAYSVRKLRTEYTGYAMKVRESGNDYTADVAFDDDGFVSASSKIYNPSGGGSDGDTIATFMSSNDGFVHTWYDQSGEGSNATDVSASWGGTPAPANQPKIYTSGSLVTDVTSGTARAALLFDSSDRLNISNAGLALGSTSVFTTYRHTNSSDHTVWSLEYKTSPYTFFLMYQGTRWVKFYYDGSIATTQNIEDGSSGNIVEKRRLFSMLAGTSAQTMIINGVSTSDASPSGSTTAFSGGAMYSAIGYTFATGLTGKMQEFIVYDSDQTSNNTGIVSEINTALEVY